MMEAKIIKITQFTDKAGQTFRTFKLQHEWDFFWFSELTFNSYSELFTISDNAISFKEPFDQYFLFEKRQNSKGEFLVLLPKKTGNVSPFVNQSVKYDYDVAIPKEKNEDIKSILARAKKITREEFEEEFGMSIDEIPISGRIDNNSSREISDSPSIFGDSSKGNEDASIVQSDPNSDLETEFKEAIKTDDEKQNLPNVPLERGKINLKDSTTDHSYKVTEDEVSIVSEPVALFEPKSRVIQEDDTTKKPIKLDPEKVKNLFAKITSSELNTKPLIDKTSSLNFDSEKYVIFTESDGLTENDKTDEPKSGLSRAFKIDSDKLFRLPDKPLTAHHDIDKDENKSHSPHDKLSFINSLINLSSKRNIDAKTRERLIGLIGKELGKTGTVEEEILREVREIKAGLTNPQIIHNENSKIHTDLKANGTDQITENAITTNEFIILGPHNPMATVKFLSSFTTKDPIKYLTHQWDKPNESFEYVSFIASVKNSFYNLLREFIPESENSDHVFKSARLPITTKSKVFSFVLIEKPEWSFEHIKIGWSSKVLNDWCLINPGKYPDDFEIPKEFQRYSIKGKEIRYVFFKELIKKFKNEIEIRTDDMQWNLKGIMRDIIQLAGLRGDFKIHLDDSLSSVQCFIDVAQLRSGLKYILEPMRKFPQYPEIEIKAKFCEDHYKLLITHKGSSFKLQHTHPKFNGIQGDFGEARKRFFWQCDWRVEGKFATQEIYSIDYLKKGTNDIKIEPSEFTEGIRHTIKLYL